MNNFDITNVIAKIIDMNEMSDFVIIGSVVGVVGYIGFHITQKSVPGIPGMIAPAAAGAGRGRFLNQVRIRRWPAPSRL